MTKTTFIKAALSAIIVGLLLFVTYCGTDSGNDDESVPVSITFSIPSVKMKTGRVLNKPAPSIVNSITISISAADMTAITDTFNVSAGTTVTRSYSLPPGTERTFSAYAYDGVSGSGFLLYQGTSMDDLTAGTSTTVIITMAEAPYTGQFVDVNRGDDNLGDGSPLNPYKTITFALSTSAGNEPINVAAGFYNTTIETFPFQLKVGTALNCYGTGYTTVIERNDDYSTAILGAGGASIEGCKISNAGPAIDDAGKQMTVNNNFIEGGCLGIYAQGNSTITNNIIRAMGGGECENAGIYIYSAAGNHTPTILNNTITANDTGIYITNGIPTIIGNTIVSNVNGIYIMNGAPTINTNILSCNTWYDLSNYSFSDVDAKNNQWDNSPLIPEISTCSQGTDICNMGGFINYSGNTLAPSPCTTPIS